MSHVTPSFPRSVSLVISSKAFLKTSNASPFTKSLALFLRASNRWRDIRIVFSGDSLLQLDTIKRLPRLRALHLIQGFPLHHCVIPITGAFAHTPLLRAVTLQCIGDTAISPNSAARPASASSPSSTPDPSKPCISICPALHTLKISGLVAPALTTLKITRSARIHLFLHPALKLLLPYLAALRSLTLAELLPYAITDAVLRALTLPTDDAVLSIHLDCPPALPNLAHLTIVGSYIFRDTALVSTLRSRVAPLAGPRALDCVDLVLRNRCVDAEHVAQPRALADQGTRLHLTCVGSGKRMVTVIQGKEEVRTAV
ncbi:hypothetical protein DFH09DRAFT_1366247 [Mycena vulgaris]|nr:hypothetical protein DFH09DRAFT_1366247 [Mycena vulgaris]